MDNNLKRSIILDNYQNPCNKGLLEDNKYIKINSNNESCIDDINLEVLIENNIIIDIHFDGEACCICTSSTSIMIKLLLGKTLEEAKEISINFNNMINELPYNNELLEEANCYDDIHKQPSRKKCALLPWIGIDKILFKGE